MLSVHLSFLLMLAGVLFTVADSRSSFVCLGLDLLGLVFLLVNLLLFLGCVLVFFYGLLLLFGFGFSMQRGALQCEQVEITFRVNRAGERFCLRWKTLCTSIRTD